MASGHPVEIAPTTPTPPDQHGQHELARRKARDLLIHNAKSATDKEQSMTLMQGIRLYPKAILWSVLISTCIVMEGYDVCLINNFCACPVYVVRATGRSRNRREGPSPQEC